MASSLSLTPAGTVRRLEHYAHHIAGGPRVTCFYGHRIVLVIDDDAGVATAAPQHAALFEIVHRLESMLSLYDDCVGRVPKLACPLDGRVRYEVAFLPNAAGLAHHGVAGIATGPAFLKDMLSTALSGGPPYIHHVFFYETCRNYVFPEEYTAVFDYHLQHEGPACTGWVNQGMVNILGCLLSSQLPGGIAFDYYGRSREAFMNDMQAQMQRYIDDPALSWDDVFSWERLPWDPHSSLDNVYSGLLALLVRRHGVGFLRRFFRAIPLLLQRCPRDLDDVACARDNFYLASSYAAGEDQAEFFTTTLRWPISEQVLRDETALTLLCVDPSEVR